MIASVQNLGFNEFQPATETCDPVHVIDHTFQYSKSDRHVFPDQHGHLDIKSNSYTQCNRSADYYCILYSYRYLDLYAIFHIHAECNHSTNSSCIGDRYGRAFSYFYNCTN